MKKTNVIAKYTTKNGFTLNGTEYKKGDVWEGNADCLFYDKEEIAALVKAGLREEDAETLEYGMRIRYQNEIRRPAYVADNPASGAREIMRAMKSLDPETLARVKALLGQ